MKRETNILSKSISIIDEIFKNKGRQNVIGTLVTGLGITIAGVGISILANKPDHYNENKQSEEEVIE